MSGLQVLHQTITDCTLCPRLTTYRRRIAQTKVKRFQEWEYWGRPIPGFGDPKAQLFVLGLAPAAHGGNRTGRVFTGDRSGDWLYEALHQFGFSTQAEATHRGDGLKLHNCYVGVALRCAPPDNKPTKEEFNTCRPYLQEELRLLPNITVVVALGKIAFDEYLKASQALGHSLRKPLPKFGHGSVHSTPWGVTLLGSYHPSQQNTFTGRLTRPMFHGVFHHAKKLIDP
ncbi:uracil-DNA glycosylase [Candidatus Nitronereus thalassa]|uniref:Type-5 uracil-DNA glycosylase n=1 Tax=Candidatus Nitronereus thalassa TaxID=3020898 RepID=A0ABU3K7U1_9BACT|nr:uracil-DNA glycosylase [Candidatus Nitronereus thalassa]MDT7042427.1 uracil-DNA glycosylase [Candidatus Nitronereus thalassa]